MAPRPTLLVLTPSTGGYFFGALLDGIARVLAAHAGRLLVVQTLELGMRSDELGEPPDFTLPIAWDQVDGAIAVTSAVPDAYIAALHDAGVPLVMASTRRHVAGVPRALPDNRAGTRRAVEHLAAHGHRSIGFVGNLGQTDIHDRYTAYTQVLADLGLPASRGYVFDAPDNSEGGGVAAAAALLGSPERPTAVMVATDRNAIGLVTAVQDAGLTVPTDLAVASFDDIEPAAFASPPLTTVSQSFDEVGALAARLVLGDRHPSAHLPHQRDGDHHVPATLVTRGSCGCSPRRGSASHPEGHAGPPAGPDPDLVDHEHVAAAARLLEAATQAPPLTVRRTARLLRERLAAHEPSPEQATLAERLSHLEGRAFVAETRGFDREFDEQFGVDTGLLGARAGDPRRLTWLTGTHVRAGVLALWRDGRPGVAGGPGPGAELEVVGLHDPDGVLDVRPGAAVPVERFPPESLVEQGAATGRRMCVVVPVRTRSRDWGLLALIGRIDTTSARETYHHWATLLGASLDQRDLREAIATSERRYATAARATNEGLWEWDIRADELYLSDRGRELLAVGPGRLTLAHLLDRVHTEDRTALRAALGRAVAVPEHAVEVELRLTAAGPERWLSLRGLGVAEASGQARRVVGSVSDIDTRKQLEGQLRHAALYDAITGLPNRRLFLDRLEVALHRHVRERGAEFAVVFLDLDGFKLVNDSLGHLLGDELLRVVGERIHDELRAVDTAARFGGDEFAVLLAETDPAQALQVARRLQDRIAEPVQLGGEHVAVSASMGIATSRSRYRDAEDVLRDADVAMYHAKESERGTVALFDPVMHGRAEARLHLQSELRAALAAEQFVVHYQPIVSLDGAPLTRLEALVRWQHPERGLLPPTEFLPVLDDTPGIVALGTWVVGAVCAQLAAWRRAGATVTVSVNLSHREFWSPGLPDVVARALAAHDVPPACLVLEITETVAMTDVEAARGRLAELRALGVGLHVDDFGTGTSSLHALRSFPVDALKIDGSFVRELDGAAPGAPLVSVIIQMGRALGIDVVAECVETADQAARLRALGCADAQGWLYAAALPAADVGPLLGTRLTEGSHLTEG